MKRSVVCALLLSVGLSVIPAWGADGGSAGTLGVGASFNLALGTPIFDLFYEIPTGSNAATRFTVGILAFTQGAMAFSVDASFLLTPALEGFKPYFGGGAGGIVVAAGGLGGVAAINLTVNGIAGTYFALSNSFGIYGQLRLLGIINLADMQISALLLPGVGLYVMF